MPNEYAMKISCLFAAALAAVNLLAAKPEEYGYYFWWGDTVGYACASDSWGGMRPPIERCR